MLMMPALALNKSILMLSIKQLKCQLSVADLDLAVPCVCVSLCVLMHVVLRTLSLTEIQKWFCI